MTAIHMEFHYKLIASLPLYAYGILVVRGLEYVCHVCNVASFPGSLTTCNITHIHLTCSKNAYVCTGREPGNEAMCYVHVPEHLH